MGQKNPSAIHAVDQILSARRIPTSASRYKERANGLRTACENAAGMPSRNRTGKRAQWTSTRGARFVHRERRHFMRYTATIETCRADSGPPPPADAFPKMFLPLLGFNSARFLAALRPPHPCQRRQRGRIRQKIPIRVRTRREGKLLQG